MMHQILQRVLKPNLKKTALLEFPWHVQKLLGQGPTYLNVGWALAQQNHGNSGRAKKARASKVVRFFLAGVASYSISFAHANVVDYFDSIKSNPKALYAFFKNMPKGGELHYHLAGGAYPEVMLTLASKHNYCLNQQTLSLSTMNTPCFGVSSKTLSNNPTLYQTALHAWSMQDFKPSKESGHDHFFASFFKFYPIVSDYSPELLVDSMQRAANQHELYLEVMIAPDDAKSATYGSLVSKAAHFDEKKRILLNNPSFQSNINQTASKARQLLLDARHQIGCDVAQTKQPPAACQLTVAFQYIVLREQPLDNVFAQALNGFAAAAMSNNIVGINLVQAEDGVISMRDYRKQMAIFAFLHKAYPTVPIALHAGELALLPNEHSTHIQEAIAIGQAQRIGHGVAVLHEKNAPKLLQHMASNAIPVEINLTSNRRILNVFGPQHPLRQYLDHGVPVVFSTDDEGILRTNLTHQYVNAVIEHHLDYQTIKSINRNALTYAFLPGQSLWMNAQKSILVPECQFLFSHRCHQFIKNSPKAQLQWQLERQLLAFESQNT